MGLLDGLLGQVLGGALGGGQQNALINVVMGMLGNNAQGAGAGGSALGGLGGLLDMLKQKGLGDQAASWVGTGENMPVSADQITNALGGDQVANIAQQAGLEPQQASAGLAALLPQLIDKLTPNGAVPQGNDLGQGLEMLKKMLS
jgi:uncharacterized protein YidB (DUF937 family)